MSCGGAFLDVRQQLPCRDLRAGGDVQGGDAAGQPLLTLEAMKMEHVHAAPRAGRVAALHIAAGAQVAARQLLAHIEEGSPA
ncbi:MAG: acetyl-CoA carboxylase biotin carboxyl carrier protein subunit [Comamonadaceae bacterium]|nr:MAG: acetyl-CoA carboxylase biotin carboxyl carrier protein subunit [Comamonadaceae bacterium]